MTDAALTPLQEKILQALRHTDMRNSDLQRWVAYPKNSGSFHHALQRMENAGLIHKDKGSNKWKLGRGPGWTPKVRLDDEPGRAVEVVEKEPGHRVVKFGLGWKAGKGLTAQISRNESPLNAIF
jgi:hypothetical protein